MNIKFSVKKCLAGVLSAALILQGPVTAIAQSPAASGGMATAMLHRNLLSNPFSIQIPFENVSLKEVHRGQGGRLIIHIQDAHANYSGQINLSRTLDYLMEKYGIGLVLVEGSSRTVTLDEVRKIAKPDVWRIAARRLLMDGVISGEEHLNLTSERPMKIAGVEYKKLYNACLKAYADLAEQREEVLLYLRRVGQSLERIKNRRFPRALLEYEESKARRGADGLAETLKDLVSLAQNAGIAVRVDFPETARFLVLSEKEKEIDFNRATEEQSRLLRDLSNRGKRDEITGIVDASRKAGTSQMAQLAVLNRLFSLAAEEDFFEVDLPALSAYRHYLGQFAELKPDTLLKEEEILEDAAYAAMLQDEADRKLRAIDRYLEILRKAYRIRLSSDDFALLERSLPSFPTVSWQAFLNEMLREEGYLEDFVPHSTILDESAPLLFRFYELVVQRDRAFVENTGRIMGEDGIDIAFLIAGGYHSANLGKLLREEGISYAVLTPSVEEETDHAAYEKTLLSILDERLKTSGEDGTSQGESGASDTMRKAGLLAESGPGFLEVYKYKSVGLIDVNDLQAAVQRAASRFADSDNGDFDDEDFGYQLTRDGPVEEPQGSKSELIELENGDLVFDKVSDLPEVDPLGGSRTRIRDQDHMRRLLHAVTGQLGGRAIVMDKMRREYPELAGLIVDGQDNTGMLGEFLDEENPAHFSGALLPGRYVIKGAGGFGIVFKKSDADADFFKTPLLQRTEQDPDTGESSQFFPSAFDLRRANESMLREASVLVELAKADAEHPELGIGRSMPRLVSIHISPQGFVSLRIKAGSYTVSLEKHDFEKPAGLEADYGHEASMKEGFEDAGLAPDVPDRDSRKLRAINNLIAIAYAINAMHGTGMLHRDIKPGNVLVSQDTGEFYLSDFGGSVAEDEVHEAGVIQSGHYTPPNVAYGAEYASTAADVFSFLRMIGDLFVDGKNDLREMMMRQINPTLYGSPDDYKPMKSNLFTEQELEESGLKELVEVGGQRWSMDSDLAVKRYRSGRIEHFDESKQPDGALYDMRGVIKKLERIRDHFSGKPPSIGWRSLAFLKKLNVFADAVGSLFGAQRAEEVSSEELNQEVPDGAAASRFASQGEETLFDRLNIQSEFPRLVESADNMRESAAKRADAFAGVFATRQSGAAIVVGPTTAQTAVLAALTENNALFTPAIAGKNGVWHDVMILDQASLGRTEILSLARGDVAQVQARIDTSSASLPAIATMPAVPLPEPEIPTGLVRPGGINLAQVIRHFQRTVFRQEGRYLLIREAASVSADQMEANQRVAGTSDDGKVEVVMNVLPSDIDAMMALAEEYTAKGYEIGFGVTYGFLKENGKRMSGYAVTASESGSNTTLANLRLLFLASQDLDDERDARRVLDRAAMVVRWLFGEDTGPSDLVSMANYTQKALGTILRFLLRPQALMNMAVEAARIVDQAIPWGA